MNEDSIDADHIPRYKIFVKKTYFNISCIRVICKNCEFLQSVSKAKAMGNFVHKSLVKNNNKNQCNLYNTHLCCVSIKKCTH
jgi:hypothetical protein